MSLFNGSYASIVTIIFTKTNKPICCQIPLFAFLIIPSYLLGVIQLLYIWNKPDLYIVDLEEAKKKKKSMKIVRKKKQNFVDFP